MKRLSSEGYERARHFLMTQARPLDRALFAHHFDGAPAEAAVEELGRYQNSDGGFGHALEPDVRTPASSALATGIALELMAELGCPTTHRLVRSAIDYLMNTFNEESGVWRVLPREANEHPHAPWWHDDEGSLARLFDHFLVIPRAQIVSLLYHYVDIMPAGWLKALAEKTVADIERIEPFGSGGGSDLTYTLMLAECENAPPALKHRLILRLRAAAQTAVNRDPHQWEGYVISPLTIASRPQSLLAGLLWEDLQTNLDWLIGRQADDGAWDPNWNWGQFYPDIWESQAKPEWRGHLTLKNLYILRAYGRL